MNDYGVTLLSGGLDSTTVTTYARGQTQNLTAVTFQYGQSNSKEIACAIRIADILNIKHQVIDISFLKEIAWYSALTNPDQIPVPNHQQQNQAAAAIPVTYVPLRNTIFMTLASAFLESSVLYAIEKTNVSPDDVSATVYIAPNAIDYSGYPDCRPEFFHQLSKTLGYGSKLCSQYNVPIEIETPIIHMSKSEIVQLALDLDAPIDQTWSCYKNDAEPCGTCDSCLLRSNGFAETGVRDPIVR